MHIADEEFEVVKYLSKSNGFNCFSSANFIKVSALGVDFLIAKNIFFPTT